MRESATLSRRCMAEATSTFILVFFGVGSVHAAVLTGAQQGIWQVVVVWGVAISLAIYATGARRVPMPRCIGFVDGQAQS